MANSSNPLLNDPLMRLASDPLFNIGLGLLQGSAPAQGNADPFGGAASGLQQAMRARASVLGPMMEHGQRQERFAAEQSEKRQAEEREFKRQKQLVELKAKLSPGKMPTSDIQVADAIQKAQAAGDTERVKLLKDLVAPEDSAADIVRAMGEVQAKSEARQTGTLQAKSKAEFRDKQINVRSYIENTENMMSEVARDPAVLSWTGKVLPDLVMRVKSEAKTMMEATGSTISRDISRSKVLNDKSYWGPLAATSEAYRNMRYDNALQYLAATQPGQKFSDFDMRAALNRQGSSPDFDTWQAGLRRSYKGLVDPLKIQARGTEFLEFNEDLFSDVPSGEPDVQAESAAQPPQTVTARDQAHANELVNTLPLGSIVVLGNQRFEVVDE